MAPYKAQIAANHPALQGHFPGNPVVPGVVILDHVLRAARINNAGAVFSSVKFISPLKPGETFAVDTAAGRDGRMHFTVSVGERGIATGSLPASENAL
ncbi:hypothetical protein [Thiohalomonas denitrificans]|uniref:hypothetical protein n=1 Tax=Thiohalomonas denitrificans TaxID=415747 RepID=UPI0026ED474E|nr:hypothetical protein [Thiohalomonas denitrificans]